MIANATTSTTTPPEKSTDEPSESSTEGPSTTPMPRCENYGCNSGWYYAGEHTDTMRNCKQSWCCPLDNCNENQTLVGTYFDEDDMSCYYECTCKSDFWSVLLDDSSSESVCVGK